MDSVPPRRDRMQVRVYPSLEAHDRDDVISPQTWTGHAVRNDLTAKRLLANRRTTIASSSGVQKGNGVDARAIPEALSERLGIEATTGLVDVFERQERDVTEAVLTRSVDRFERRLMEEVSKLRDEIHKLGSDLRERLADQKFELLTWSFLFSVWQVATIAALLRLTGR